MNLSRIVLGLVLIVGATGAVVSGTGAFFSDMETSAGNFFTAGAIDLLVDNESYFTNTAGNLAYNTTTSWGPSNLNDGVVTLHKFFDFNDLKPDDIGEDTISLHVQNDAYACMSVTLISNDDNSCNEPENADDPTCAEPDADEWDGELAQNLQMFWWSDDGDNVYETGELGFSGGVQTLYDLATTSPFSVALADSDEGIWGGPIPADVPRYIGKAWCFGTLAEAAIAQDDVGDTGTPGDDDSTNGPLQRGTGFTCDGEALNNAAQTDQATLDVEFTAVQARNNPTFQCEIPEETRACEGDEVYASATHDNKQGRRKNGTAVTPDRTNPTFALGAPQSGGTPFDNPVVANSFFSLGFNAIPSNATATTTPGGSIVLEFPGVIVDEAGPDLQLWEVTGGTSYPDEVVRVEASNNLAGPWTLITNTATRDASVDLNGAIASAKYIRITDMSVPTPFEATADGYDLDAVQALNCEIADGPQVVI